MHRLKNMALGIATEIIYALLIIGLGGILGSIVILF